jgi:hypothetical protein
MERFTHEALFFCAFLPILRTFNVNVVLDFTFICLNDTEVKPMRTLWKLSGLLVEPTTKERRYWCFRILNCFIAGFIGLIVWLIVRLFALDSIDWLICFVGYPVMFHGVIGSSIYLMNVDDDSEE